MFPYYLLLIPFAIGFFFLLRNNVRNESRDRDENLALWDKLNAEVLEVSLLVAAKCPANADAHTAVIEAAQCLVFPKVGPHTIVSAGMVSARYKEGFDLLETARALAAKPPTA